MASIWILTASLLLVVMPVTAVAMTGNELKTFCESKDPSDLLLCLHYVVGVGETASNFVSRGMIAAQFCTEELGVTEGQVKDVVLQFMQAHPQIRHRPAAGIILASLGEAFPCPTIKGTKP